MDDEILDLLDSSGLILSPVIIAVNINRSREGVTERITELREHGLIERIDRGRYVISKEGEAYLEGELDASELDRESDE